MGGQIKGAVAPTQKTTGDPLDPPARNSTTSMNRGFRFSAVGPHSHQLTSRIASTVSHVGTWSGFKLSLPVCLILLYVSCLWCSRTSWMLHNDF